MFVLLKLRCGIAQTYQIPLFIEIHPEVKRFSSSLFFFFGCIESMSDAINWFSLEREILKNMIVLPVYINRKTLF